MQSDKLAREEEEKKANQSEPFADIGVDIPVPVDVDDQGFPIGVVKIRPVRCLNEWVAVIRFTKPKSKVIVVGSEDEYLNKGLVIGSGTGVAEAGRRIPCICQPGDMVLFEQNSIVKEATVTEGIYKGFNVIFISERNVFTITDDKKVKFQIVDSDGNPVQDAVAPKCPDCGYAPGERSASNAGCLKLAD